MVRGGRPFRGGIFLPTMQPVDSEMQQGTVATAGFEHAQASTAETHLAKENMDIAALSQAKLLSRLSQDGKRQVMKEK